MKRLVSISLCFYLMWGTFNVIAQTNSEKELVIGSKNFTENIILAEIATQLVRALELNVSHKSNLGGSRILWTALRTGEIAAYPEYTGTLIKEIFSNIKIDNFSQLEKALEHSGVGITGKLGFNNTYVIGMLDRVADSLAIK